MDLFRIWMLGLSAILTMASNRAVAVAAKEEMVLAVESDTLRLAIGSQAHTLEFIDKNSGSNFCSHNSNTSFARIKRGGKFFNASSATVNQGDLVLHFAATAAEARLKLTNEKHSILVEVVSVTEGGVEEMVFTDVQLALKATPEEPFAACALALNLQTNVREIPGATSHLEASCYPRFGFAGAKVALIGCPQKNLRQNLQRVVQDAPELPHSPIGGPWALDAEINQGSYLFNFSDLSEDKAEEWIQLARALGMNQIDFHGGSSFRFGDCEPNAKTYPKGRASLKAVVDKLHAAGIKAGLHTYAFFLDKKCPWVTPVPDARLAKDAMFTLAAPLDASTNVVFVSEATTNVSAVTGFFVRNSVTLQVDDELIIYSGVSQTPPYSFTNCQRGALGTHPAPHEKGAKTHHLKECFGLFVPDGDSTLLEDVAARTARTFNECGFDMMYLDALDGEDILGGGENSWHYGSKFVFELWKRLDHPALMEMSTFHHHLWYVRSRMGAWDHPTRSHKRFIDLHAAANAAGSRMFLPMHLGWWAVKTWTGPQGEPTFADDIEYLCGKAIGNNVGFSLMGVDPAKFANNPALQRLGKITRQYEELRHANYFPESVKASLRVPGDEFTLEKDAAGSGVWRFRPVKYSKHKVETLEPWSSTWTITNSFEAQPLQLRLEVLMSAEPYNSTNAISLAGFNNADQFAKVRTSQEVAAELRISTQQVKEGASSGWLSATNNRSERSGTWVQFQSRFTSPVNLGGERALGVWVLGDGHGEVLNLQLRCPEHLVAGIGEHYVPVDFTGWRYFELIEPEGEQHSQYSWPYGSAYDIYRETVDYRHIASLSLWLNQLPAKGTAECFLSDIHATPLVKAKISSPRITVGQQMLVLPVEIESGSYLEINSRRECSVFGPDGTLLKDLYLSTTVPTLESGVNRVSFGCEVNRGVSPRVKINIMTTGNALKP